MVLTEAAISLVISTRNRHGFVADAVDSVLRGTDLPDEIVVIDQSDAPHPRFSAPAGGGNAVRYVWTAGRGLSRGRNQGIRAARHDLLAFIDDDVIVEPDWLAMFKRALAASRSRSVLMGRVLEGEAELAGAFAPSVRTADAPAVYRGRVGEDVLMPNCMLVPRAAFEEVGDFDERLGAGARFPSSEDNDFGYRLLEAGYEIVYAPEVVVRHRAWRPPGALVPLRFDYGRGQGAYFAKHFSRRDAYMRQRLWHTVLKYVKRAPRRAFTDPRAAAGDLVFSGAVILGAIEWLVATHPRGAEAPRE
jgi:GT2 family glycosyltransferase